MRRVLLVVLLLCVASVGAVLAYAPYLPQLLLEGMPPLLAPAHGHFATITGVTPPRDLRVAPGLAAAGFPATLEPLFETSGGRAFLVARDGTLQLEHYGAGVTADTRLNSFSMVKGLVGALVYRALAEGRLESLEVTLARFFPDDPGLAEVSIGALLAMRSGIAFEPSGLAAASGPKSEITPSPFSPLARLHFAGLGAITHELRATPGPEQPYSYQNANTALLGAVLEQLYATPLATLLDENI